MPHSPDSLKIWNKLVSRSFIFHENTALMSSESWQGSLVETTWFGINLSCFCPSIMPTNARILGQHFKRWRSIKSEPKKNNYITKRCKKGVNDTQKPHYYSLKIVPCFFNLVSLLECPFLISSHLALDAGCFFTAPSQFWVARHSSRSDDDEDVVNVLHLFFFLVFFFVH